jgi:hypothetical protein
MFDGIYSVTLEIIECGKQKLQLGEEMVFQKKKV